MIVVTGMHRSGTSLAAQVLQALGADFGPEERLYGADDWNANGYLERIDAVDLNSRAITGFARTSGRTSAALSQLAYLRMPAMTTIDRRLDECSTDIASLADELSALAVKDPRFCLTLGGWKRHGRVDSLVVALRHPSASVASLRRRNRLPVAAGHRFWRWHMQAILPHIDERTLVIRQDRLVGPDHASEVARIGRWLSEEGVAITPSEVDVLDRGLVHHEPDDAGVPPASLELWEALIGSPGWSG